MSPARGMRSVTDNDLENLSSKTGRGAAGVLFLASFVSKQVFLDPAAFLDKVGTRFRLPALRTAAARLSASSERTGEIHADQTSSGIAQEVIRLVDRGEYGTALDTFRSIPKPSRLQVWGTAQRAREALQVLYLEYPKDTAHSAVAKEHNPETQPHVHSLLTNSLPHTQSGYTVRSHSVFSALQRSGTRVTLTTRLGYPLSVGRFDFSESNLVGSLRYHRMPTADGLAGPRRKTHSATKQLVKQVQRSGATCLHTTTPFENALVVSRAASELGLPWIYEVRGVPERTWLSRFSPEEQGHLEQSEHYRRARFQETQAMLAADAVIALSEVSKAEIVERGVPADKIWVLPNAVEDDIFDKQWDKAEIRRELDLPDGPLVGTVTSLVDYEGIDTLLRALVESPADIRALIVGDGVELPKLKELAQQLGITDRVIFAGRQPSEDIWKWYAALDVFALPRKKTSVCELVTPIKPLIALALGIPVVGSTLPAIEEVTGGLLIGHEANDATGLSAALVRAFEGNVDRGALVEFARTRTWARNAELFRSLLGAL